MTTTYVPDALDVLTYEPRGTIGPLAGVDYHVALGYYPETDTISRWDVAQWDTPGALWEGAAPLDDVSCDVVSVSLTEGRDLPLGRFRPGTATVVLNDPDGIYSPWRTASDPAAFAAVRVGIDLIVWAMIGGTRYPRFRGTVESIADAFPDEGGQHRVTFRAVDYLAALAAYDGTEQPPIGAGELTGARLVRIARNAGYTGAVNFDTGTVPVQATTLARNALDESGVVVDTETGAYWCDRDGVLQFRDINGLLDDPRFTTPQAVFGDDNPATEIPYTDVVLSSDTSQIRNVVSIANAGGTAVTRSDVVSVSLYRPRTYQRFDLVHVDPAQSVVIANRHLAVFAYAANRVQAVTVDLVTLSDAQRAAVLALDTLHMLELRRRPEGFQVVARLQVQGQTEEITGTKWTITYRTFSASSVFDVGRWDSDTWDNGLWGY